MDRSRRAPAQSVGHPVFADGRWTRAADVRPTDELVATDGSRVPAGEPRPVAEGIDVYDLSVDGPHTYFAGGRLVHNKSINPDRLGLSASAYYQLWPGELPAKK